MALASLTKGSQVSWVESIKQHPNVRVQQAAVARQQWRVVELQAGRGVDVDLSTSGHVPIIENYSNDFTRVSKKEAYVDLELSVKHTLYDFGAEQALVDSESSSLAQQRLEYVSAFAEQAHAMWTLGLEWQLAMDSVTLLRAGLWQSNQHKDNLIKRFEAGVGTISELRTQQLYSLDIDNQIAQWLSQQQQVSDSLTQEYQLSPEELSAMWQPVKALLSTPRPPQSSNLRSAIASQHAQQALHKKMKNLRALAKPQLSGEVNTTLYDATNGTENNDMAGKLIFSASVFDNGVTDAQTAGLNEQVHYLQDVLRQLVSKKALEFNDLQIQSARLQQKMRHNQTKQMNIKDQIVKLEIGLGSSHNNVNGLALLQQQLLQEQVDALSQTNKQQELLLKQVFVTEQLVKQLQLDGALLNEL